MAQGSGCSMAHGTGWSIPWLKAQAVQWLKAQAGTFHGSRPRLEHSMAQGLGWSIPWLKGYFVKMTLFYFFCYSCELKMDTSSSSSSSSSSRHAISCQALSSNCGQGKAPSKGWRRQGVATAGP